LTPPPGAERPAPRERLAALGAHQPARACRQLGDRRARLRQAGSELAVADLDEDGTPEVMSTAEGADESLAIDTLDAGSPALRPRLRLAVPEPVRALAVCPPEDHGEPTLVAVTSSEIWLVRAATSAAASP